MQETKKVRPLLPPKPIPSVYELTQLNTLTERRQDRFSFFPIQMMTDYNRDMCKTLGVEANTTLRMLGNGDIPPLSDAEQLAIGGLPDFHIVNMSDNQIGRLRQIGENPEMIADFLSSIMSPLQFAAMVGFSLAGLELWFEKRDFTDYYNRGRRLKAEALYDFALDQITKIPSIIDEANCLADDIAKTDHNDGEAMAEIRQREWALSIKKIANEQEMAKRNMIIRSATSMLKMVDPSRWHAGRRDNSQHEQQTVSLHINLGDSGVATGKIIDDETCHNISSNKDFSKEMGIVIEHDI
jgi:hypothetical protein